MSIRSLVYGNGINDSDYLVSEYKYIEDWYLNGIQKRKTVWRCPFHGRWVAMLGRCYAEKKQRERPTYKDCTVCEEWLTFSNFRKWMITQEWEDKHLDKDLLLGGNKIYSPSACVFVTQTINNFLTDCGNSRGEYLVGCCWIESSEKYQARCSDPFKDNARFLGYFDTEVEAHLAWKRRKHEYACRLSRNTLITDNRVRDALLTRYQNYTIVEEHLS